MNILIVRWTDKQGKQCSKEYTDENTARKARDWLTENGIEDADIAIKVIEKQKPAGVE